MMEPLVKCEDPSAARQGERRRRGVDVRKNMGLQVEKRWRADGRRRFLRRCGKCSGVNVKLEGEEQSKNWLHFSICACHPCAGAMLIFSVSFQFYRVAPPKGANEYRDPYKLPNARLVCRVVLTMFVFTPHPSLTALHSRHLLYQNVQPTRAGDASLSSTR